MPEGAVYVGRPSKWGNPFVIGRPSAFTGGRPVQDARHAFVLYRSIACDNPLLIAAAQAELRGRNLACWCAVSLHPRDGSCHADVLLDLANAPLRCDAVVPILQKS